LFRLKLLDISTQLVFSFLKLYNVYTNNTTLLTVFTTNTDPVFGSRTYSPPEAERLRPFPRRRVLWTGHGDLPGVQLDQQQSNDVDQKYEISQH
jgi:hypothetical protein